MSIMTDKKKKKKVMSVNCNGQNLKVVICKTPI